jgi:hypothetical protein
MTKITVETYRDDKYYPKVVGAVEAILAEGDVVAAVEVFVHMEMLRQRMWSRGASGVCPISRR